MYTGALCVTSRILRWLGSATERWMTCGIGTGIDWGWMMSRCLLGSGRHGTGRSGSVRVVGVARRAAQAVLVIHGETGGGGGASGGSVNGAVGGCGG